MQTKLLVVNVWYLAGPVEPDGGMHFRTPGHSTIIAPVDQDAS